MHDDELVDHQARTQWQGATVLTLASLWPERPRAMVVGLHPVPCSVEAGHYFQGAVGQRQLRRLTGTGLFDAPADGTFYEAGALSAGVGFTNVVPRPASGTNAVSSDEITLGREVVTRELAAREVPLVVCLTRLPVQALLGSPGTPGFQRGTVAGARVFRMPGPFTALADVAPALDDLRIWLADA